MRHLDHFKFEACEYQDEEQSTLLSDCPVNIGGWLIRELNVLEGRWNT